MIPIIVPQIGEGSPWLPTPHMAKRMRRLEQICKALGITGLAYVAFESEWWVRHRARCPICRPNR